MKLKEILGLSFALVLASETAARASEPEAAQWVTLGTSGGPAVQAERSQIANALVVGKAVYLFDVGNGVQRQMAIAGIPEANLKAVFITHHHLDHNAALGPIIMTRWTFNPAPLPVFGPPGTVKLAMGLAEANAPTELAGFPTAGPAKPPATQIVQPHDLSDNPQHLVPVYQDEAVRVWAIAVDHYQVRPSVPLANLPEAVGYRVEAGGRIFAFTGDSGPSATLVELARGADVLITEVVEPAAIASALARTMQQAPAPVRDGIVAGMTHNHLTPHEIGNLASAAAVKRVVLTHFVPSPEAVPDRRVYSEGIGSAYFGPVALANDLDRF